MDALVIHTHRLAYGISDGEGSMAEPLAVALHAVNRAGPLLGKRVLVTGCGPIGALVVIAAQALRGAFDALRPRGVIVQLGLGGEMTLPINTIVAKEFDLRGAFRFHAEFATAVELINKRLVDLKPLISATLPYRDAGRAFALAADRSQAMKLLLSFD